MSPSFLGDRPPAWIFKRQLVEACGLFMPQIIPILFGSRYMTLLHIEAIKII
jgi:hypothetical protein